MLFEGVAIIINKKDFSIILDFKEHFLKNPFIPIVSLYFHTVKFKTIFSNLQNNIINQINKSHISILYFHQSLWKLLIFYRFLNFYNNYRTILEDFLVVYRLALSVRNRK